MFVHEEISKMTIAVKVLYAVFAFVAIALGMIIGGTFGWETHGLVWAAVLGAIGGFAGAVLASLPTLVLQVLR